MLNKEEELKKTSLSNLSIKNVKNQIKKLEKIDDPIQILTLTSNAIIDSSKIMLKRGKILSEKIQSLSFLETLYVILDILLRVELISPSLAETVKIILKSNDLVKVFLEGIEKGFDESVSNSESKDLDVISRDIGKIIADITKFL